MIKAFKGTSLIDFPGEISCVIFTGGCNLRCPYCYNKALVDFEIYSRMEDIPVEFVKGEIQRRKGFITGCTITGGEPTIHGENLLKILSEIRSTGVKVKLDTNGMLPKVVEQCVRENLVDYIALDIKAAPDTYSTFGGNWDNLEKTLNILKSDGVEYEIRITAVPKLIKRETLKVIGKRIKPVRRIAIQKFVGKNTLDPSFENLSPYSPQEMKNLAKIMEEYCSEVIIR